MKRFEERCKIFANLIENEPVSCKCPDNVEGGGPEALSLVADLEGAEDMIFTPDITAKTGARRPKWGPTIVKPRKLDEALVFRTFLRGRSSRSIAVAYPGKVNINWSADSMNLDQLWRGDFVNAASNWNTRGGGSHID